MTSHNISEAEQAIHLGNRVSALAELAPTLSLRDLNILFIMKAFEGYQEYIIDVGPEMELSGDFSPSVDCNGVMLPEIEPALDMMDDMVCAVEAMATYHEIQDMLGYDLRSRYGIRRFFDKVTYEKA